MRFEKARTEENANDSAVPRRQASMSFFVALSIFLFAAFAFQLWYHATRTKEFGKTEADWSEHEREFEKKLNDWLKRNER